MAQISKERFSAFRQNKGLTQQQMADILGISAKYVGMIERGEKEVEELGSLGLLFRHHESGGTTPNDSGLSEKSRSSGFFAIPVLGWAHAGLAATYEELPKHWQETIPTDCRDAKAFAVVLEGDSMEPYYREGDTLVLMPSQEIHNGCLAVIRFANDGVIFRRVETRKGKIRLVPFNTRYEAEEHDCSEISWAYPVYERRTQVWRG